MTRILLVSATTFEIDPVLRFLEQYQDSAPLSYRLGDSLIDVCITQVGMVNTAFSLGRYVNRHYHLAVNAGLAGSFGKYKAGAVVNVTSDRFSELGAEDGDLFLSIDEMGFGQQVVEVEHPLDSPVIRQLPVARGITVNTVHGNEARIREISGRYAPDTESMEGAAFIHAANAFGWTAIQLRAISNPVERRNKNNWQIPLAVRHLNQVVQDLLQHHNINHTTTL